MNGISESSAKSAAQLQMAVSMTIAKKTLDVAEMQGDAVLKLMESAKLPDNSNGQKGNIIDVAG